MKKSPQIALALIAAAALLAACGKKEEAALKHLLLRPWPKPLPRLAARSPWPT